MRTLRKLILLTVFAIAPLPAFGQQCGGFSDIDPNNQDDFFCDNVEWIKNRAVTLGCTDPPGAYCKNHPVLRSQMAAFMNRLGTVLTPLILRSTDAANDATFATPLVICESTLVAAAGYPRQASFTATVMNFNANADKTVQGRFVYRADGGPWTATPDSVMWQSVAPGQRTTLALTGGPLDLAAGPTYEFALQLETNQPIAQVDSECQLNVRVENRNAATTPL